MIRARMKTSDDKEVWFFGLSERNLTLLKKDQPIIFKWPQSDGTIVEIVIAYGETEDAIVQSLAPLVTPETHIVGKEQ